MKPNLPSASVAVITRTKDRPELARRAMDSVLGQSYQDWVHIIVNDGGQKEPLEALARAYEEAYDGRLHIVHHESSKGMQNASNAGLDASESEYVTIHDDDDSWTPKFLEKTVAAIEEGEPHRKVDGAVSQSTRIFEEITFGGEIRELKRSEYYYFEFANLNEMRRRNLFPPIAFVYRRKAHDHVGQFKQDYDVLGDHDFNLRFLRHYNITVLKEYLANYHWRMHAQGNTVTRGVEKHRVMLDRLKNDYLRESLSGAEDAIGDLDAIPFPPLTGAPIPPFRKRESEASELLTFPDPFSEADFECLSLDVFDTALLRHCHIPTDVFKIVEARIPAALGREDGLPFALARSLAERKARESFDREVTLDEIYKECEAILNISSETAETLKALELTVEEEMLYAHPRILALATKAANQGKKVIYVSDMYLSSDCIGNWLQKAGYPKGDVLVSSEFGESKHTGALYPFVFEKLSIDPNDIVHLGDNLHSDFIQAKAHGLRAFHLPPRAVSVPWCDEIEPYVDNTGDNWSSIVTGLVRRQHQEGEFKNTNLLHRLGYELAGPLYFSYLRWVCAHAKANGIRRLLLLGRDGYYLEKALRHTGEAFAPDIEFTYIEASRKALCFASFDGLEEAALEFLSTPHPSLSASDFLTRLGLNWENYTDEITTCGFDDPSAVITKPGGGDFLHGDSKRKLEQLFQLIRPELEALFAGDREAYTHLFNELGFDAKKDAIVDLGWAASSAKALSNFFGTSEEIPLQAYYFGTWENAVSEHKAFVAHGYFMDKALPADNAATLSESINWIEALFSAPFQTLLSLELKDGCITPNYSSDKGTGFSSPEQSLIWDGAEAFLSKASPFASLPVNDKDGWSYLDLTLKRLLQEPSPAELEAWGHLQHSDGFGLEMHQPLIIPCAPDAKPQELLKAYDTSTWKRGFLSKVTENQANFVIERRYPQPIKTYEEVQGENLWLKQKQDEMWAHSAAKEAENARLLESVQKQTDAWKSNQAEIAKLRQASHDQAKAWEANQAEIKRLSSLLDEKQNVVENKDSQIKNLQTENQAQAKVWETNQNEIARLKERAEELDQVLEKTNADLSEKATALESDKAALQKELERLQSLKPFAAMKEARKRQSISRKES